jgi:tetratricopeptide (TPR) repeat protein
VAEKLAAAEALKREGNALFGEGRYDEAADKYQAALEAGSSQQMPLAEWLYCCCSCPMRCPFLHTAPETPGASKQRAIYLANLAACDVHSKRYTEAVEACTAAVQEDPTFIKVIVFWHCV